MLAAIMFTDMVGYTALMQENERKAKILRDKHRVVLDRLILEHRGQILQYYGDGTLSIFGSAIEAAVCGAKIQQELQSNHKSRCALVFMQVMLFMMMRVFTAME